MTLSLSMQIYFILGLLLVGSLTGFIAGFFGLGGGVILVPFLVTLFPYFGASKAESIHIAVGTSLALMIPSSISATYKQHRLNNIDWIVLRRWAVGVVTGIISAVLLAKKYPHLDLNIIFMGFLYFCLILSLLPKKSHTTTKTPPSVLLAIASFITGGLATFVGVGGGTMTTPFFKACGYPIKKAIAIASASSILISFGGTLTYILTGSNEQTILPYSIGYISLPAFIFIAPLMFVCAPIGVKTAHKMKDSRLRYLYSSFLACLAIYMTIKAFF